MSNIIKIVLVAVGVFGIMFGSDLELLSDSGLRDGLTSAVDGVVAAVIAALAVILKPSSANTLK